MATYTYDESFKLFAKSLEGAIAKYGENDENLLKQQKRQIEKLIGLEKSFRKALVADPLGFEVYQKFIEHICEKKKNILSARPYFRERQENFTAKISQSLKEKSVERLQRFNFNYQFIRFVMGLYDWSKESDIWRLAKEIGDLRQELIVQNMPLAISRARIFYSRTPKAQLEYMDLVQIAAEGLMSAIDKFVLPFSSAFRAVVIGRCTGNFIHQYSETLIHFYPIDKRKIYRANKLLRRQTDTKPNYDELAAQVNVGMAPGGHTNGAELASLMLAQSYVSSETPLEDEDERPTEKYASPITSQPDYAVEENNSLQAVYYAISKLPVLDQKILKLKGLSF